MTSGHCEEGTLSKQWMGVSFLTGRFDAAPELVSGRVVTLLARSLKRRCGFGFSLMGLEMEMSDFGFCHCRVL